MPGEISETSRRKLLDFWERYGTWDGFGNYIGLYAPDVTGVCIRLSEELSKILEGINKENKSAKQNSTSSP